MTEENEQTEEEKPGMINEAHDAAKRLEEANAKKEELLDREQEITAQRALSGQTEAGQETSKPELTEQEKTVNEQVKALGNATGANWAKDKDGNN